MECSETGRLFGVFRLPYAWKSRYGSLMDPKRPNTQARARRRHHNAWAIAAALMMAGASSAVVASADIEMYIHLDNKFYKVGLGNTALSYFFTKPAGYAWVAENALMANCTDSGPLSQVQFYYGYGFDPPVMLDGAARYAVYGRGNNEIAVLTLHSVPGNTTCLGAVPKPSQYYESPTTPGAYDKIFADGFERPWAYTPDTIFADGFDARQR